LYYGGSNLATGAIKRLRTNTVGVGLHLKSTIDGSVLGLTEKQATDLEEQIEREFAHWANSVNCDLERLDNFYQLQQLALLNALLSGDSFALMTTTKRQGSIYDLRINLIEADRVSTPDNQTVNPLFCEGVEKNKDGEVVAYHISKFHPLSFQDREPREWVRVEAFGRKTGRRNVLHIMNRERIGQVRGVPFLSPVIETIKQLGRYTEAEVLAAVINGLFTVFIEKESASDEGAFGEVIPEEMQVDREDENSIELAPGAVIDLGEGEKANMVNPGRPNPNFDPFVMAVIKQIGAALEIPYEILIMAFSNNYSASRAAILEFFKVIKMYRAWFVADFCQPIYEEWLSEAVAKGRIYAPGFFNDPIIKDAYCSAEWNGPAAGQLDPKKEVEAAELRVQGGFSTRERETTELTGTDFYKNIKQRKREEELMQEVSKNAKKANADNRDKESDEDTDTDKDADRQDNPGNDSGEEEGEAEE
jgi:lambda family phage portal protein